MGCNCAFGSRLRSAGLRAVPERTAYLDYAATTPPDPRVLGAFDRCCRRAWGNPSSLHPRGLEAASSLESSRERMAGAFRCDPAGLRFCASGTEALQAALLGFARRRPSAAFVSTGAEHAALAHPLRLLAGLGRTVLRCPLDAEGRMDSGALDRILSDHSGALLAYAPVNHETGTVQRCAELYAIARRRGCEVLLDAVQAAPRLGADEWAPYGDAFSLSAHKFYAPKGTGALWVRPGLPLGRSRFGGGQEGGLFPGTENTPGIAAAAEAAALLASELGEESVLLRALEADFFALAEKRGLELRSESPADHAPGLFCISLPWADSMEELLFALARRQVCVSRFSACSGRVEGPSRVLSAMGRDAARASFSLRIGLGRFSKREDLYALLDGLAAVRDGAGRS